MKKKNSVWAWDINVPSDGSVPTCTFTPWNELPRRERFKRTLNALIAMVCIFYSFYKATYAIANFSVKALSKGYDFMRKCKAKLHEIRMVMTDMKAADDASEYVMPEEEYRRHASDSESDSDDDDKPSASTAIKVDGAAIHGSKLAFTVPGFTLPDDQS